MNPYSVLGLQPGADQEEVHAAYIRLVKQYHPDRFEQGSAEQQDAQQKLVELNIAYEQCASMAHKRPAVTMKVSTEAAEALAERMLEQGSWESAIMQLCRTETKDARWFYLQGKALMGLKQYSSAHQSFREAVRMEENNREFRQGALDAAVAMKKHNRLPYRMLDWVDGIVHPRKVTY